MLEIVILVSLILIPLDIPMGVYAKNYQEIIIAILEDDEIAMKGDFLK